ncbi:MAG: glyoxylase-like metal-dependent hydrolase (beta-lactamase superfamily II), partial [Bermanella sp.]
MTTVDELITQRPSFAAMEPACQTAATRINDFIYMSCGTSNSYMVKTAAGRVIINTGMGFEALIHKKLFDKIYPGPTRYILLTQGHVDHVGGVNHFRDDSTQLVAQQNNLACQKDDERIATVRISQTYI